MKIQFWPHAYDENIASYRIRCLAISKLMTSQGINSTIVKQPTKCDTLILSKRYDSKSLDIALQLKENTRIKIVLDICDNHLHQKYYDFYTAKRRDDLIQALNKVDLIVASSQFILEEFSKHIVEKNKIKVIDDIIEKPFNPSLKEKLREPISEILLKNIEFQLNQITSKKNKRLIWFGNASGGHIDGGLEDLKLVRGHIESLSTQTDISLTVISNSYKIYKQVTNSWKSKTFYLPWSKNTVTRALNLHGIAVIPINKNPFTRSKTANRVTTCIVHELAVIADSIPSYQKYSNLVFLEQWKEALEAMVFDEKIWQNKINFALNSIDVDKHNIDVINQWQKILHELNPAI